MPIRASAVIHGKALMSQASGDATASASYIARFKDVSILIEQVS
jgi:hypothetical protein